MPRPEKADPRPRLRKLRHVDSRRNTGLARLPKPARLVQIHRAEVKLSLRELTSLPPPRNDSEPPSISLRPDASPEKVTSALPVVPRNHKRAQTGQRAFHRYPVVELTDSITVRAVPREMRTARASETMAVEVGSVVVLASRYARRADSVRRARRR